jgi:ring-1,2-phenylacetyl-CoA epoxidase subunit PaaD
VVVWSALDEIPDPEIPAVSVVELGVIGGFTFAPRPEGGERLTVKLLPTFVGCPAIDVMQQQIGERLRALELVDEVEVQLSFTPPWTSDRISPEGREKLRGSGFAPPVVIGRTFDGEELQVMLATAECPYCGSRNTTLENPFGPTLCRAIYHCADCRQPFEQFKSV